MAVRRKTPALADPFKLTMLIFAVVAFMYFTGEVLRPLALSVLLGFALVPAVHRLLHGLAGVGVVHVGCLLSDNGETAADGCRETGYRRRWARSEENRPVGRYGNRDGRHARDPRDGRRPVSPRRGDQG